MRKLIGPFLFCILFFFLGALFEGAGERSEPEGVTLFFLPCVRGGGRRGTSLTEGLLCTRESDPYTPSASPSFGTSLSEGGKRVGRSFSMRG